MWYLADPDVKLMKDKIFNLGLFNSNWTMGVGPDFRASMVLEQRPEDDLLSRFFNMTKFTGDS